MAEQLISCRANKEIDLSSLKVYFSPIQSGTGDPSPSNVRPITGWTGVNVTRSGKNMLNKANYFADTNYIAFARTTTIGADGSIKLKPGTYTFSASQIADTIAITNKENRFITTISNSNVATFTVSENIEIGITFIKMNDSAETLFSYNYQLECGATPTTFEPYVGNIYQADWTSQGTQYNGYIDLISGQLVATLGYRRLSGNDDWYMSSGISGHCAYRPTLLRLVPSFSNVNYKSILSDKIKGIAQWATDEYEGTINQSGHFYFGAPEALSTSEAVNNWIQEIGGIDIVYPLTEPITYQLTSQQIKTLVGRNNIWSNADGIEPVFDVKPSVVELRRMQAVAFSGKKRKVIWNQKCENFENSKWETQSNTYEQVSYSNGVCTRTMLQDSLAASPWLACVRMRVLYPWDSTHIYYFHYEACPDANREYYLMFGNSFQSPLFSCEANVWTKLKGISNSLSNGTSRIYTIYPKNGVVEEEGSVCQVKNPMLVDLTQMYGAGNEPTTVEEFERQCALNGINLNVFQPYDSGTEIVWTL